MAELDRPEPLPVPQWRGLRKILSENFTEPTVVQELSAAQIQYEVYVRQAVRWPSIVDAPKALLAVVGRALSCVVMPLYADWVQYRKLLSEYLNNLNAFLPKFSRQVDGDLHRLRTSVSRAMDRIDFLERRLTLLEAGQLDMEEYAQEEKADDKEKDIAVRIQAAQRRAARVRGRSRSPAPSVGSQYSIGSAARSDLSQHSHTSGCVLAR